MDANKIKAQAESELHNEQFREAVDVEKERLKKPFCLFPWKITVKITRRKTCR